MATGVNSLSESPIVLRLSGFVLYFLCREREKREYKI